MMGTAYAVPGNQEPAASGLGEIVSPTSVHRIPS